MDSHQVSISSGMMPPKQLSAIKKPTKEVKDRSNKRTLPTTEVKFESDTIQIPDSSEIDYFQSLCKI